ncbi:hypothetical protein M422DRAFT_242943 [Sphaerobolus stellatus SS14]|nr:hypothetical protein M422DRAFT_242943 [Sphaerobolus stellatus SS14]
MKQREEIEAKHAKVDLATLEYINHAQSDKCMQEFAVNYFHPHPSLPGSPGHEVSEDKDKEEVDDGYPPFFWKVEPATIHTTEAQELAITRLRALHGYNAALAALTTLHSKNPPLALHSGRLSGRGTPMAKTKRCRVTKCDQLQRAVKECCDWILTDTALEHMVDKAHFILGADFLDPAFLCLLLVERWFRKDETWVSLIKILNEFWEACKIDDKVEGQNKKLKAHNVIIRSMPLAPTRPSWLRQSQLVEEDGDDEMEVKLSPLPPCMVMPSQAPTSQLVSSVPLTQYPLHPKMHGASLGFLQSNRYQPKDPFFVSDFSTQPSYNSQLSQYFPSHIITAIFINDFTTVIL